MTASTTPLKALKGVAVGGFWIAAWYLLAFVIGKEIFLPFPHTVVKRLFELSVTLDFWKITAASLVRIILGFLLGSVIGVSLAVITARSRVADALFSPAVRALRATPVVSFILLAYLWLDNDTIPVFIALLMVVPVVWQNTAAGISSLDKGLGEMARVFGLPLGKRIFKIILPQLSPYLYSGCLSALGLAWKSGIAAEVISYPKIAIGKAMNDAKVVLETADVLVWTVVVVALSLIFEGLFKLAFKKGGR